MMKKMIIVIFFFLFVFLSSNVFLVQFNLFVDIFYIVFEMVIVFFSDVDVVFFNVIYIGVLEGMVFFDVGDIYMGINVGIFLFIGLIIVVANLVSFSVIFNNLLQFGDVDLQGLLEFGMMIYDVVVLEFDIVFNIDIICFNYIFGFEEYLEFVGS